MDLAKEVYVVTSKFPSEERFGLSSQMRRAAVSIPSNIAEGHARSGTAEFLRFISIALGSTAELETQIILSSELGYLHESKKIQSLELCASIGRMLRGLQRSLHQRQNA